MAAYRLRGAVIPPGCCERGGAGSSASGWSTGDRWARDYGRPPNEAERRPRSTRSMSHSKLSSTSADHWNPPVACRVAKPWKLLRSAQRVGHLLRGDVVSPWYCLEGSESPPSSDRDRVVWTGRREADGGRIAAGVAEHEVTQRTGRGGQSVTSGAALGGCADRVGGHDRGDQDRRAIEAAHVSSAGVEGAEGASGFPPRLQRNRPPGRGYYRGSTIAVRMNPPAASHRPVRRFVPMRGSSARSCTVKPPSTSSSIEASEKSSHRPVRGNQTL